MADKPARTKLCPTCNQEVDINRGVCQHCGYMFPWFRIRLMMGGCGVIAFILGITVMTILAIMGSGQ